MVIVVGVAFLVALHLWTARDISQLSRAPGDQFGYLGNARWLSGDPNIYLLPNFPYFGLGYPLVLSPLFRIFEQPDDLSRRSW